MFDFEDSKFGRVRIISVTEARANIAAIMADTECNYVITKNNKPVRAIVSYEVFKKSPKSEARPLRPSENSESIKGILENRSKDLKQTDQKPAVMPETPIASKASQPIATPTIAASPTARALTKEDLLGKPEVGKKEYVPPFKPMAPPPVKTPEPQNEFEDDYYKRYRKLYEPLMPPSEKPAAPSAKQPAAPAWSPAPKPAATQAEINVSEKTSLPSIQDILRDLEKEKLSDETDDLPLDTDDIRRLMNKISGS